MIFMFLWLRFIFLCFYYELDLSNYATKPDSKGVACINTSKFAKKVHLASLKLDVDKLDINKLKTILSTLNDLKSKVCSWIKCW